MTDEQSDLVERLRTLNEAVLDKVDGLDEFELRRPMTPTGTNLLGVVKHLASVQAGYFGDVFGRPWPDPMPWLDDGAEINADMYATEDESADEVRSFLLRSWEHSQATFAVTDLDDTGEVPWWPEERRHPTLRTVMLHMTVELARHAGHLDIVRELIDGATGRFAGDGSVPGDDEFDWARHLAELGRIADTFRL